MIFGSSAVLPRLILRSRDVAKIVFFVQFNGFWEFDCVATCILQIQGFRKTRTFCASQWLMGV